jgi:hypothetical protein
MAEALYTQVVKLAERLTPDERQALIEHLSVHQGHKKRPTETLKVFTGTDWPQGMTLRREDEYGDDGR